MISVASGGHPVTIKGVTITGGSTSDQCPTGSATAGAGGGICVSGNNTLTVINSTITGNSATNAGGGIYMEGGDNVTIKNSTISNNISGNAGGGIFCWDAFGVGTLTISNSTISGNTAASEGGGIQSQVTGCAVTVTGSTLSNNAAYDGGGILNGSGSLTLKGDTFSGNSASDLGGGLFQGGGNSTATISSTAFSNNSSGAGCGAIEEFQDPGGSITLAKSDGFTGNTPNNC